MKRIYLLMAAALGLTTAATAQRTIDVTLKHYYEIATAGQTQPSASVAEIANGSHIVFDGDENVKVFLSFEVFNNGATANDTVALSDTLHIRGAVTNVAGAGIRIGQTGGSGKVWSQAMPEAIMPGTDAGQPWEDFVSKPVTLDWCDSVWFNSAPGSANPVTETNNANNITCHSVVVDGWMTGIEDVKIQGNGLIVAPNPSNGNMNVVYNFGNNNSGVITIVDVTGKIVYTQQLAANLRGVQTIAVRTQGLATGLYSLRLATGNKVAVEKIYINN